MTTISEHSQPRHRVLNLSDLRSIMQSPQRPTDVSDLDLAALADGDLDALTPAWRTRERQRRLELKVKAENENYRNLLEAQPALRAEAQADIDRLKLKLKSAPTGPVGADYELRRHLRLTIAHAENKLDALSCNEASLKREIAYNKTRAVS